MVTKHTNVIIVLVLLLALSVMVIIGLSRKFRILESRLNGLSARFETSQQALIGTSGASQPLSPEQVAQVRRELELLPAEVIFERSKSFVELYSYDKNGASSYGTASYIGNGYFLTVKHAVVNLKENGPFVRTELRIGQTDVSARVIDVGDANEEVGPGDWAVVKTDVAVHLPILKPNTGWGFRLGEKVYRYGNDYSRGIMPSSGDVGQRTVNGMITCLMDGHPGVSGGGVLNSAGQLVAIPNGRMMGDYRFSFVLPVRNEMFKKVPHLSSDLP